MTLDDSDETSFGGIFWILMAVFAGKILENDENSLDVDSPTRSYYELLILLILLILLCCSTRCARCARARSDDVTPFEAMAEVMAPKLPIQNRSTISPRCKSPGAPHIRDSRCVICMQVSCII